ncbi:MAG: hypothetical protein R2731_12100 [Nocardioides sp.]
MLTTERVVFLPWNTADVSAVLAWALPKAGLPGGEPAGEGCAGRRRRRLGVTHRRAGVGGAAGSVSSPPTLVVTAADGSSETFGVTAGVGSPNWARRNVVVRDQFVAAAHR